MSYRKIVLLLLTVCTLAYADEASHRKVANEVLNLASGPEAFRAGFAVGMDPLLQSMKQNGASAEAIADMKAALDDWMKTEFSYEDLRPQILELWVREFTEPELNEILAFYRTPTGKKTLAKFPALIAEGAKIGQAYAAGKQASLLERINKVVEKHHLNK